MNRDKNKVLAGVLGILLGGFGVHHFYLGSIGSGVICLVASLCFGLGGLVGLIEGIMLLVMDDGDFERRYVQRAPESVEFVFMKPK